MSPKIRNPVIERTEPATHAGALPSPCISVCSMNPQTGWCDGCYRSIDEIALWGGAGEAVKHAIWEQLKQRYAVAENAA